VSAGAKKSSVCNALQCSDVTLLGIAAAAGAAVMFVIVSQITLQ
jgi:hypothetical protein